MLSKFFRTRVRFDDQNPVSRREAVLDIPDPDLAGLQADLAELARTDDDPAVRKAAVSRLRDVELLAQLLRDADSDVSNLAAAALAAQASADPQHAGLLELPGVREAALRNARDPAEVDRLAAPLDDLTTARLALENRNAKVRLALAERVFAEEALTDLERHSRDRDKNVHRLARTRLDEVKHARAEQQRALERAAQLLDQLETLAHVEPAGSSAARLTHVRDDWRANLARLHAAHVQLQRYRAPVQTLPDRFQRFEALAEELQRRRAAREAQEPATTLRAEDPGPPQPEAPETAERADSDPQPFIAARVALEELLRRVQHGEIDPFAARDELQSEHSRLQQLWLSHADHHAPPEALADEFHQLTHGMHLVLESLERACTRSHEIDAEMTPAPGFRLPSSLDEYQVLWERQRASRQARNRIERLLQRIEWPDGMTLPRRLAALGEQAAALAAFDGECHAIYERLVEECQRVGGELETQIEEGHLNGVVSLEADAKRLLRCLPAGAAKHHHQHFHTLSARLQELKDWQNFVTGPKRQELCEQVESLAEHPLEPKLQADRIKALRRAWNALGPITHYRDRRLLDRFNAAAERAFEPCRAFFESEADQRRFNMEQREVICNELERYLHGTDWTHPDWKAAERILHTAQNEWRKFYPVDRSAGRKTQQRFEALCDDLHGYLKAEWDRNIAAKEAIVGEAGQLRDSLHAQPAELHAVIERAKALQRAWRGVGVTPRGPDQRLWKAFRHACDDIFGFRDESRQARHQAVEDMTSRAEALCDEFQRRLESAAGSSVDAGALSALRRDLDSLGELPRDAHQRVQRRVRDLEAAHRRAVQEEQRRRGAAEIVMLQHLDQHIGLLELAVARGEIQSIDALQDRLAALADGSGDLADRALVPRIHALERTLIQQEHARFGALAAAAGEQRHRLAIEAEIRAGLNSPAEDQQRRLALQVERLNQGFKQPVRTDADDDPLALARRWCLLGPWDSDAEALSERFFSACVQRAANSE
jgi:DNA repair protein SbcC/Rad50